jgi:hypothetical protein
MFKKVLIGVIAGALLSPLGFAFSKTGGEGAAPRGGSYCSHKARAAGGSYPTCTSTSRSTVLVYRTERRPVTTTKTTGRTTTVVHNATYATATTERPTNVSTITDDSTTTVGGNTITSTSTTTVFTGPTPTATACVTTQVTEQTTTTVTQTVTAHGEPAAGATGKASGLLVVTRRPPRPAAPTSWRPRTRSPRGCAGTCRSGRRCAGCRARSR